MIKKVKISLKDRLLEINNEIPARFEGQKDGSLSLEFIVAERKVFLSKKRLIYKCRLKIDHENKSVTFSETLVEKGFGLSAGDDMSPGFGFKKETYKIIGKGREGNIEEVSKLFGKEYKYNIDYSSVREKVKKEVQSAGYSFLACLL